MKIINFKKAVEALGYHVEKVSKGYNFRTIWATKDGQLYYFHIEDLRDAEPFMFYRTAENMKDFRGGVNHNDMKYQLEDLGYKVIEPRKACDYNSM